MHHKTTRPNPYSLEIQMKTHSILLVEGNHRTYLYTRDLAGNVKRLNAFPTRAAAEAVLFAG